MPVFYPLKLYLKHRTTCASLGISLILQAIIWIWLVTQIPREEGQVFLHYTVLFGVDTVGTWRELFAIPFTGFGILFFNALLGWMFFQKDKYLAHVLNVVSVLVHLFLLAVVFLLVTLNA